MIDTLLHTTGILGKVKGVHHFAYPAIIFTFFERKEMLKFHQKRREKLRGMSGSFTPSPTDLDKAKQRFLAKGGVIRKLMIASDSVPNVWGDFVKSRIRTT